MINPTKADIGRSVLYVPKYGKPEMGVITSFDTSVVFVRYGSDEQAKATYKRDLFWSSKHESL